MHVTYVYPGASETEAPGASSAQEYLKALAESYRWLELQGILEAGSLRVELEKVYVALKAEPESDYALRHLANLHSVEVREAAGGTAVDLIEPTRLAELDAQNVRRTYRPLRDEAKRSSVTQVQTIADAFRLHDRAVLLGGPGSGKTTLGRWLALQLARAMLAQLPHEVAPETEPQLPEADRIHVPPGAATPLARSHFTAVPPTGKPTGPQADKPTVIRFDELPARGSLALFGRPVKRGQTVPLDQVDRLTFTPAGRECGSRYAHLRYTVGAGTAPPRAGAIAIDVGVQVLVPLSQVDPEQPGGPESGRPVNLGPARMPIFLRLAHYARELAERERNRQPGLSLEEYLGCDPDSCGRADGCSPKARNVLLRRFLDRNAAVVILDGLDELPEANRRTVLLRIQDFIEKTTRPNAPDAAETPWRSPGNQVLVTSRYVGYKLMPIRCGCAHFGIQPMQRPAVEHFARAWTRAVSAELGTAGAQRPVAEALIAEIYDDTRPAIRELATNPLLITILATVYWADGRLPDQRASVYDRVVENLLRIWLDRPECRAHLLERDELLAALEPLAADLQEDRGSNGLISLDRIAELIEGPLAAMRHSAPTDRAFRPVLEALLTTIRKHVGLLAEQSSGNYAFFHRTFQEFLAARHLLSDRESAARRIVARLDDPLWREPLLLALGLVIASTEWAATRTRLLEEVLAGDDRSPLIPRGAMLLVSAVPTLDNVPRRVIDGIVGRLLDSYAISQRQPQAEQLREGIRDVFARLRDGSRADVVAEAVCEAIRDRGGERDLAGAGAEIMLRLGWFTTDTVDALLQAVQRDRADLGWPVNWALLAALGRPDDGQPYSRPRRVLNTSRLVAAHLPMRRLLESSPELTAFVRCDTDWQWLLIALYGGLGRTQVREKLLAFQRARLDELRFAMDDAGDEPVGPPPAIPPIDFCPGDIVHDLADAELSRTVLRQLRMRKPPGELAETFRRVWRRGTDPAGCAEALVGLAALGTDVVPLVSGALADPQRQTAARAALDRFRWIRDLLREPLIRSTPAAARTLPPRARGQHQLDLLRIVIEGRTAAGGGPLPVSDTIPSLRYVDADAPAVRDEVDAEEWAYLFSGFADQDCAQTAVGLGPLAVVDLREPERLVRGWAQLSRARNHFARPRLAWPQRILAPRCDSPVEHYVAMLEGLMTSPPESDRVAGYVLGRCGTLLDDNPGLIWETLAVCCLRGKGFTTAYLAGAAGDGVMAATPAAAAADLVRRWDQGRLAAPEAEELRGAVRTVLHWRLDQNAVTARAAAAARSALLKQASRIADPYLRFRALWLLSGLTGREPAVPVLRGRSDPVELITDPHDHARALEWILMTIPGLQIGLGLGDIFDLDSLLRGFALVEDSENRARAQCRLALLAPERLDELLAAAAESVALIADPARRAETIEDIRFALGGLSDLTWAFDEAADDLPDPWLKDKALGRASRLINAYRSDYAEAALVWRLKDAALTGGAGLHRRAYPTGRVAWGALYLDATAAEVGALEMTATGDAADWELLLGPDWRSGVDALVESAADGALRITPREASVVVRIVQAGRSEVLERLWGHLECLDPQAMAVATRWNTADPQAERWKALVQAEAGRLTAPTVDLLVELISDSTDRLRLRGALALHGPSPYNRNRNRRWSVARVGAQTLEAIGRHISHGYHAPFVFSSLSWMRGDIHHDDADALNRWLAQAAAQPGSPAERIIENIESIDEALVAPLLRALPQAPPGLQQSLLIALSRLADSTDVLAGSIDDVRSAIAAVPAWVRQKVRFVPEGPATFLKTAASAAARPDPLSRLDAARAALDRELLWLDDQCLSSPVLCHYRLKRLGSSRYIQLGTNDSDSYWARAAQAAADFAEDEEVLRLLLSWIESLNTVEDSDGFARDLLTAADALAQLSPNAFTALADPDVWESILTDWVQSAEHWAVRLAAVRMLGLLRRVSDRVAVALRAAMKDVSFVQQAAYDSVAQFRTMKRDITTELLALLGDQDAGVVASTARLLVSLARSEGATTDRRRILRGLQDAVAEAPSARQVYLMAEGETAMSIRFVDRLDRILYRAIFEVGGL